MDRNMMQMPSECEALIDFPPKNESTATTELVCERCIKTMELHRPQQTNGNL